MQLPGTGKTTKHVESRYLYVQNLANMGLLWIAKTDGTWNPADLMTKYVAADVLQRLKTQLGLVSNWFKGQATDAHDADDNVAPAHSPPLPYPRAHPARHCAHCCSSGYRWTEVHADGLCG